MVPSQNLDAGPPRDLGLTVSLLASYLFFLQRRPISASNTHYLASRLRGLQSLAVSLEHSQNPGLREAARKLRLAEPASFQRVARALQFELALLHKSGEIPSEYLVSARPPLPCMLKGPDVLLILGPAIGIGDEMILFPLPAWVRAAALRARVTVMSGYRGLWDRVRDVDEVRHYADHADIVRALRGELETSFDTVIVADFEKPGLVSAVCREASVSTYVELSIGGQSAAVVDTKSRRVHMMAIPSEGRVNYYETLDRIADWLGLDVYAAPRYGSVVERRPKPPSDALRIFVSPFTSKYDPSLFYWSSLLSSLASRADSVARCRQLLFRLDAGPSLTTERFAIDLLHGAKARATGTAQFELAGDGPSRRLGLSAVFDELEQCDVALCADSFVAHAAPIFGCSTVVIARRGLEGWRVPFERGFYLDLKQPIGDIVTALGHVLGRLTPGAMPMPPFAAEALRLHAATEDLRHILRNGQPHAILAMNGRYDRFVDLYLSVAQNLYQWPSEYAALLQDVDYQRSWGPLDQSSDGDLDSEAVAHLRVDVARWEKTNLFKLLRLAAAI